MSSVILPRVLIVSRRTLRKNKFVDFVGEYHLELIVTYGAVPVIVPRVSGVHTVLSSFEPIHGVLLCEGEDIEPCRYEEENDDVSLSEEEMEEIRKLHASDVAIDKEKDSIELSLAKLCLERNIPFLGICRGSQLLNVACGGTLFRDIGKELSQSVLHINYDDYDGHRHAVKLLPNTPLHRWFQDATKGGEIIEEIWVNSYHHQGVKRLAQRFVPMAFAHDGLIEGFYDPRAYDPQDGNFIMGLQFHPERMRNPNSDQFDYPGCPFVYQEFVKSVIAYQKKVNSLTCVPKPLKLNKEMEMENMRKIIMLAKNLYTICPQLQVGPDFLESNTVLSVQQEIRLKQMGATVRNAGSYVERLKLNEGREKMAKIVMGKMSVEQLSDLLSFYLTMGQICSQVLERKQHDFTS